MSSSVVVRTLLFQVKRLWFVPLLCHFPIVMVFLSISSRSISGHPVKTSASLARSANSSFCSRARVIWMSSVIAGGWLFGVFPAANKNPAFRWGCVYLELNQQFSKSLLCICICCGVELPFSTNPALFSKHPQSGVDVWDYLVDENWD